jgi:hypothetical protein
MNLSIYKNKSTTLLITHLRNEISSFEKSNNKPRKNIKIRSLIKELKSRKLSELQKGTFNKLIVRYTWI